jgi:hypothetical protein
MPGVSGGLVHGFKSHAANMQHKCGFVHHRVEPAGRLVYFIAIL